MTTTGRFSKASAVKVVIFTAVLLFLFFSPATQAATSYWIGGLGGDGDWNWAANWNGGIPQTGDGAVLSISGTPNTSAIVNYNVTPTGNPGLGWLSIETAPGYSMVLNHTDGTLWLQGNSSLTVNATVNPLGGPASYAAYNLSGTGVLIKEAYEVQVGTGLDSRGYFNQSGGTFQFNGAMYIGTGQWGSTDSNCQGVYTMTGGVLDGWYGTRVVGTDEDGNPISETKTWYGNIVLGEWGSRGDFLHSGGTVTIGSLILARQAGSIGNYELSNSGNLTVNGEVRVGNMGTGYFTQTGSTTHTADWLIIGNTDYYYPTESYVQGTGTYTLDAISPSDGSANLQVKNNLVIGDGGTGTFEHLNGRVIVDGDLILGRFSGEFNGTGTYNLQNGELLVKGNEYVGYELGSYGTFNQSGGSHTVEGSLYVDMRPASKGMYNLNGGSLDVKGDTIVGSFGDGIFSQSGGTHTVAGNLVLGEQAGGIGTYNLSLGDLNVGGWAIIGQNGSGYFSQSGGNFTLSGGSSDLYLGYQPGSYGQYYMTGGNLSAGRLYVGGEQGTGFFDQSGGTVTLYGAGEINVGTRDGSVGTYNLSGDGILDASKVTLYIGRAEGSTGTFNQSGGTLTADWMDVGSSGTGTFSQTGGANTVNNVLAIGRESTANGFYSLSGDISTSLLTTRETHVGAYGNGTFIQEGGSHTTGTLVLGYNKGGVGTYELSNGSLSSDFQRIGLHGTGTFTQTGGTNTVNNVLAIGQEPGSSGTYNLSGGTLTAAKIDNNGMFNYSGGTIVANLTNNAGGTMNISGENPLTITGSVTNAGTFNVNNSLAITSGYYQTAGWLKGSGTIFGDVVVEGGIVAPGNSPGTLTINGNYSQGAGGTLAIQLGGVVQGTSYSFLNVSGEATLTGTLDVDLYGNFQPSSGNYFDILVAKSITGNFSSLDLPTGWAWSIAYLDLVGHDGVLDTVRITANAVPIPGAVWLFAPALAGLVGLRKRFGYKA